MFLLFFLSLHLLRRIYNLHTRHFLPADLGKYNSPEATNNSFQKEKKIDFSEWFQCSSKNEIIGKYISDSVEFIMLHYTCTTIHPFSFSLEL
jgi:hypothetical protein